MVERSAEKKLADLGLKFKAVVVTGARQSGKTTLVKKVFPDKPYRSLENPDTRRYALEDPRGFLQALPEGAILDEAQRTPELFSYLQEILDTNPKKGQFILTGSNNFLLQENISQSLAGRVGYLYLLPFSYLELNNAKLAPRSDDALILKGCYPPIYDQKIPPQDWCPNYIRTYVERDVRQVKNITDLITFEKFMRLLAGRTGQEVNYTALAVETGVDVKTIQSWLGILESSFIIHLLKPHHRNFNKVVVKRPKLYFYDTALACSLLGITDVKQLAAHPLRGALFETMVVSDLIKSRTNKGLPVNLYFWRDKTGREIDIIIDNAGKLFPIEIKSGQTVNSEFFKNLDYWKHLSETKKAILLYAGQETQNRSTGTEVLNWRKYSESDAV